MATSVSTRTSGTLNTARQQLDELDALLKRMLELPVNQLSDSDEAEDNDEPPPVAAPAESELRRESVEPTPASPPVSYMVVETASPRPLPPASGFEPRPSGLAPRLVPVTPPHEEAIEEAPVPVPEPEAASSPEVWVPLRSTWQPSAQTWQPLAESWRQANGATPAPATIPTPIPSPRLEVPMPTEIPLSSPQMQPAASAAMPTEIPVPAAAPSPAPASEPVVAPSPSAEPRLSLTAEDAPVSVPRPLLPLLWFNQGFDGCMTPLGALGRWVCSDGGRQLLGTIGLLCLAAAAAVLVGAGMGWSW
jgi:hypothetical protein